VLAVGLFGIAIFTAPATQLLNDFLRHERNFSAAHISAFTILTNTPAGIGILIGGWLADVRGRRLVAAIGVAGGTILTLFEFYTRGWPMWWWSLSSSMLAAIAVPAFGVYGPELFPTTLRGRIGGLLSVITVVGSGIGLVLAGVLKDSFGHLGPAMAVLSIAPLLVTALVVVAYPETSRWELEDLNPEDRAPTTPTSSLPP
jgi:MFS family permease